MLTTSFCTVNRLLLIHFVLCKTSFTNFVSYGFTFYKNGVMNATDGSSNRVKPCLRAGQKVPGDP